jgi:hypothetical protein
MASSSDKATARSSMMIALVLHGIAICVFFVWAAKTGRLDTVLRRFDIVATPKEKKPEPQKQNKPDEMVKPQEAPKPVANPVADNLPQRAAVPPPADAPPSVAPPAASVADFSFNDGAKLVESSTNAPVLYYKNLIEYTVRANWEQPPDIQDNSNIAEAELVIDSRGSITRRDLVKPSGDKRWDDSVRKALAATKQINRPPPNGFPPKIIVRFDVMAMTDP